MKLPSRVVGGYWPYWNGPKISTLPTSINVLYLFSARPVGGQPGTTGAVYWDQGRQDATSFKADVAAFRQRGSVILSMCGAGEYLRLDTRARTQAFVDSVKKIYADIGGFDGLDWNLESTDVWPAEMVWASQQLKAAYGPDFAITYPPAPWRPQDVTVAKALAAAKVLDFVAPQYYDLGGLDTEAARRDHAVSNLQATWLPVVGGDASKVGIGFKNVGNTSETMTVQTCVQVWQALVAKQPALRGAFVWELAADAGAGNQFAKTVGAEVAKAGGSTPTPAPNPAPTPTPVPSGSTYTVKAGDTYGAIASRLGIDLIKLMAANPTKPAESLNVGDVLQLPGTPAPAPAPAPEPTLVAMPQLKKGATGPVVKTLQAMLAVRGVLAGSAVADGKFGAGTESAVRQFQTSAKIASNGVVDGDTWKRLLLG